jgi:hypothetical protein
MNPLDPQTTEYRIPPSASGGVPTGAFDPWSFRDDNGTTGSDLVGYKVEATDGGIGKIDEASHEVDSSYLVVDTGAWIFGKKVMLPAGVVHHVDHDDQKVYLDRSKAQIKDAPQFDADDRTDPGFRDKLGGYYGDTYGNAGPPAGPPPA